MGIQNKNTEREGLDKTRRNKKCKETNKMLQFLVYTTIISLSVGAPQYGGVQPSPPVKTAPLTGSVQCRTEYASQPPGRSATQCMRSSAAPCTRMCAWSSTRQ